MPRRQSESNMEDPSEHFAWAFAAGIPDPRGEQFGHQPLIPAPCFPALSRMLWKMGFRHHPELQEVWVPEYRGPDRNLVALGLTSEPQELTKAAAEMVIDQFPEIAERLSKVNAENRDEIVKEQAEALLDSLRRLEDATAKLREGSL